MNTRATTIFYYVDLADVEIFFDPDDSTEDTFQVSGTTGACNRRFVWFILENCFTAIENVRRIYFSSNVLFHQLIMFVLSDDTSKNQITSDNDTAGATPDYSGMWFMCLILNRLPQFVFLELILQFKRFKSVCSAVLSNCLVP